MKRPATPGFGFTFLEGPFCVQAIVEEKQVTQDVALMIGMVLKGSGR